MNRTEIADQVSVTLDGHVESFAIDDILDDLIDAGVQNNIDDIDSDTYWEIVRRHDLGAQAEARAVQAHTEYLQAEAAYKQATVVRQILFARAVKAMGRGGNATLARTLGLSAPTVKGIADRGREIEADPLAPEWWGQFPYMRPICRDGNCDHRSGYCERMRSEDCHTGHCNHAELGLYCAELPFRPGRPAPGWELS